MNNTKTDTYINPEIAKKAEEQQTKEDLQTKAEKRRTLFKKYQKLFFAHQETAEFKEPILILMRRNNKAEFFENATQGEFTYQHSDGQERKIILTPKNMQTFDYGKKSFKGYICHEDYPLPLPEDPILTVETIQIVIDKALNDLKKWKAEEQRAFGEMIFKILAGLALIAAIFVLYKMLVPEPPTQIIINGLNQTINNTLNTTTLETLKNITKTLI